MRGRKSVRERERDKKRRAQRIIDIYKMCLLAAYKIVIAVAVAIDILIL